MNTKNKIFISIIAAIICFSLIYYMMGQIAWDLLRIKGEAPINAWWLLFNHSSLVAREMAIKTLALPAILTVTLPIMAIIGYIQKKKRWIFGGARVANMADVKSAKLLKTKKNNSGIFLGFFKGKTLYEDQDEHVQLIADSRTGKGVSLLVPILLTWNESVIINDPKGELWVITSWFRKMYGHKVFKFAPFSSKTHRCNPFFYIDDHNPLDYIQQLSHFLWPTPANGDPMWAGSARTMFQGLCLYLYETKEKEQLTFSNILRLGQQDKLAEFLLKEVSTKDLSINCKSLLQDFAGTTEKTRSGVMRQFSSALEIFQNPTVEAATSGNDFDLRQLRKEKISLYISGGNGLADLQRMAFLNRLIFQTATILNTQEQPEDNPELKYTILLMLDEMFHMGVMNELVDNLTLIAGYSIRVLSVWQNEGQIYQRYGADAAKTFIGNHKTRIYFLPNDDDLPALCEKIGFTTVKVYSGNKGQQSRDYTLQKRELFLPEELKKKMSNTKAIIFSRGSPAIITNKAIYHSDKRFLARIVGKKNLRIALKTKSMTELKPLINPSPDLPTQSHDKLPLADIKRETISQRISQIETPKGSTVAEMDKFIQAHVDAMF